MTNAMTPIEAAFEMQRQSIKHTQQLLEQSLKLQQNTLNPFLNKSSSSHHSTRFDAAESTLTEDEYRSAMNSQFPDFEAVQSQAWYEHEPRLVEAFNALNDQQKHAITQLVKTFLDTPQDIEQQTMQSVQRTEDVDQATEEMAEEAEETTAESAEDIASDSEGVDTDLESIHGIGETYANRLRSAGIESVGQLAQVNSEMVADAAEISEDRAKEWITSAQSRA